MLNDAQDELLSELEGAAIAISDYDPSSTVRFAK
jgi:hypothetical protein